MSEQPPEPPRIVGPPGARIVRGSEWRTVSVAAATHWRRAGTTGWRTFKDEQPPANVRCEYKIDTGDGLPRPLGEFTYSPRPPLLRRLWRRLRRP